MAPEHESTPEVAAAELVSGAERAIGELLAPDEWTDEPTARRIAATENFERALTQYVRAMALAPDEPAYPWNLSYLLNRLGQHDLATTFLLRAIKIATEHGDDDWADADAHLALADSALRAGQDTIALLAIRRAVELRRDEDTVEDARRLLVPLLEREFEREADSEWIAGLVWSPMPGAAVRDDERLLTWLADALTRKVGTTR
jgi:tetratricopeptide (TPR) repeat protein